MNLRNVFKGFNWTAPWKHISQHLNSLDLAQAQDSFMSESMWVTLVIQKMNLSSNDCITKPPDRVPHSPHDKDADYWKMFLPEDFFPPHQIGKGHWNWNGVFQLPDCAAEVLGHLSWCTPLCSCHPQGKVFFSIWDAEQVSCSWKMIACSPPCKSTVSRALKWYKHN